jgi:hypothetical protein
MKGNDNPGEMSNACWIDAQLRRKATLLEYGELLAQAREEALGRMVKRTRTWARTWSSEPGSPLR